MFVDALKQPWKSPSLLGVLFLDFVIMFAISVIVSRIPVLTLGVAITLLVTQLVLSLIIHAVIASGYAVMVRNATLDGSTTIREFLPGVRRAWSRFLAYHGVRMLLIILLALPFIIATQLVPPLDNLAPVHYAGIAILAVGGLFLVGYALLWAAAIIAFDDTGGIAAMRRAFRIANAHPWTTVRTALVCGAVIAAVTLLASLAALPYQLMTLELMPGQQPATGIILLGAAMDVLAFLLYAVGATVCAAYTFRAYHSMTSTPSARKARRTARTSPA